MLPRREEKTMSQTGRVVLGIVAALTLGGANLARAGDDAPAVPAGNGMRIHLDEHGRPTVAPPAPPTAPAPARVPRRRALRAVPQAAPGGGEMIQNDHVHYSVGRVGKDGHVTADCLHAPLEETGPAAR